LYGACTTGIEWRFLKYQNNEIIIDVKRFLITDLANLIDVFQQIITESLIENNHSNHM